MIFSYLIYLIGVFAMNSEGDTNTWIPEDPEYELIEEYSEVDFMGWSDWNESTQSDHFNTSEMSAYPIIGMECRGDKCEGLRMFNNVPAG